MNAVWSIERAYCHINALTGLRDNELPTSARTAGRLTLTRLTARVIHNDTSATPQQHRTKRAKCSHSDKSWRLSENNPADVMCEYDYIAIGTTRKHAEQIVTEHNQHFTLITQRERLLAIARDALRFREEMNGKCDHDQMMTEMCSQCEIREVITTSEQEGRRFGQNLNRV